MTNYTLKFCLVEYPILLKVYIDVSMLTALVSHIQRNSPVRAKREGRINIQYG